MINRINRNGNRPHDGLSPRERRNDLSVLSEPAKASSADSTEEAISKFGAVVRKSPAASLLVALAAGLAIGFWVKR